MGIFSCYQLWHELPHGQDNHHAGQSGVYESHSCPVGDWQGNFSKRGDLGSKVNDKDDLCICSRNIRSIMVPKHGGNIQSTQYDLPGTDVLPETAEHPGHAASAPAGDRRELART